MTREALRAALKATNDVDWGAAGDLDYLADRLAAALPAAEAGAGGGVLTVEQIEEQVEKVLDDRLDLGWFEQGSIAEAIALRVQRLYAARLAANEQGAAEDGLAAALQAVIDHSMPIHSVECARQDDDDECFCGTAAVMERAYAALREQPPR